MNDAELLEYSDSQKETANKILSESNLIEILSRYGKCSIIGSLYLDLVYGSDIDVVVETNDPRGASVGAISELIERRQFKKYQYGDFVKFPVNNRPNGFIVVLISEVDGVKWETEIWFVEKYPKEKTDRDLSFKKSLTSENRLTILKLKQDRERFGDDKHSLTSTEIYSAVLVDDVANYKAVLAKVEQRRR